MPKFIYEAGYQTGSRSFTGWNFAAMKRIPAEQTVKDVCGVCNSGPLSELDSYGKRFLVDIGLLAGDFKQGVMEIPYDYELLTRWLLKLSFNSTRTTGIHEDFLEPFTPYMLGTSPHPPAHVAVVALFLKGETVTTDMLQKYGALLASYDAGQKWRPFYFRVGLVTIPADCGVIARACIFGCLALFLVVEVGNRPKGLFRRDVRQFTRYWPGSVELSRGRKFIILQEGERTWINEYGPMLEIQRAIEDGQ